MTPNQSIELREAIIRAIWFRFGSIARHGLDDPNLGKTADDILGLLHQPEKPSDLKPSDLRSSPAPSQGDVERIVAAFEADPFGDDLPTQGTTQQGARFEHYARLAIAAMPVSAGAFRLGDRVEETSGSAWHGIIVGTYSTSLTPEGYAVESEREPGSVQIYPAKALRLSNDDGKEGR